MVLSFAFPILLAMEQAFRFRLSCDTIEIQLPAADRLPPVMPDLGAVSAPAPADKEIILGDPEFAPKAGQ